MKFKDDTQLPSSGQSFGKDAFLKLEPGKTAILAFRGEPHDFRTHWINNKGVLCAGSECQACKDGLPSSFRFRINVILKENGLVTAKILEQGRTVYNALRDMHTDYPLDKHLMKVTRIGSGKETSYSILPAPKGEITPEMEKQFALVTPFDLDPGKKEEKPQPITHADDPGFKEQDLPF